MAPGATRSGSERWVRTMSAWHSSGPGLPTRTRGCTSTTTTWSRSTPRAMPCTRSSRTCSPAASRCTGWASRPTWRWSSTSRPPCATTWSASLRYPTCSAGRSALDRPGQYALGEEALQERIDHQNRHRRDHHDRHLNRLRGRWRLARVGCHAAGEQRAALQHVLAQHELDRPLLGVVQVQDGIEKLVPVPNPVEERDDRQDRLAQGQHNLQQNPEVAGPIDPRTLQQLRGNAHEELPDDHQVERTDRSGQDQGSERVDQAELFDEQVIRNQAGGEDQRKQGKREDESAARHARTTQAVGHGDRHEHARERSDGRNADAHQERARDDPAREDDLVRFERGMRREQDQPTADDVTVAGEADGDHVHEREEHRERQKDQQHHFAHLSRRTRFLHPRRPARALSYAAECDCYPRHQNAPSSPIALAIRLAAKTRTAATTPLSRPTAALKPQSPPWMPRQQVKASS